MLEYINFSILFVLNKVLEGKDTRNILKLKNVINSTWRKFKFPYFKTLVKSMPKRLKFKT
jgi:hypothetical protein